MNTDDESPTTPTKPSLSVRERGRKTDEQKKRDRIPSASEPDEDSTEEVASMIMSERASPPPASSDDFGGYD